jgi:hypothetical protein
MSGIDYKLTIRIIAAKAEKLTKYKDLSWTSLLAPSKVTQ